VAELKILRGLYAGRAVHGGYEQWMADISSVLEFAARNPSPGSRWTKSGDREEDAAETEPAAKEAQ
jgi:hypothetical protein